MTEIRVQLLCQFSATVILKHTFCSFYKNDFYVTPVGFDLFVYFSFMHVKQKSVTWQQKVEY